MSIVMKPLSPFNLSSKFGTSASPKVFLSPIILSFCELQPCRKSKTALLKCCFPGSMWLSRDYALLRTTRIPFCYPKHVSEDLTNTQLPKKPQNVNNSDNEELELLNKPFPMPVNGDSGSKLENKPRKPDKDEILEPFFKFFKQKDSVGQVEKDGGDFVNESQKIVVEYYEPKPGDFVVGVVVSGNENKLDVNVGADTLGTMLTKEILPLYDKEMDYLLCDLDKNAEKFMANGKMGIAPNEDAICEKPVTGRPVVDVGSVLFAEVLGRTLSGRPLLSARRFFRRIAWHRVRQIKQLDEPVEVRITEWNTGGLLTRIEGLRAFVPKAELVDRVNNFSDLKEKVGCPMYVQISQINEANNDLILSEREAWEKLYLREGTLLEGTVKKILPYGAQVRIGQSNRSGLLHVSNISRGKVSAVSDLLAVGENVKVLVVKSLFTDKISLSIAHLESEPGLFMTNKEKVFAEAEQMTKKYRQRLPAVSAPRKSEPSPPSSLLFEDDESLYANWKWFKFEWDNEPDCL